MNIIRDGKVIYNSELTEGLPPELIIGDVVTLKDCEYFNEPSGIVYDVVLACDAKADIHIPSLACPEISFVKAKL